MRIQQKWKFQSGGKQIKALKFILPIHTQRYAQVDIHTHIHSDNRNKKQSL